MRSIYATFAACLLTVLIVGCGAEEKKLPVLKPEEKAKNDASHKAAVEANKGAAPAAAPAAPAK